MRFTRNRRHLLARITTQRELEAIRETKWSFNLALICTAVSSVIIFTGIILVLTGHLPLGLLTTLVGLICTQVCQLWLNLWRETKKREQD
jgi:CHASE2 domain-containing sensor protein